jgi:hypothetical protein
MNAAMPVTAKSAHGGFSLTVGHALAQTRCSISADLRGYRQPTEVAQVRALRP